MKILIIGASGTIGSKIAQYFQQDHEIVTANPNSGDYKVDIADIDSIVQLFNSTGTVDAIGCAAGEAIWGNFDDLTAEDYHIGIRSKLMGQVNLARIGKNFSTPNGSITLTTGILADDPVLQTTSAAMVNGGIHSFVQAAALELTNVRINVVSTGFVEDAYTKYQSYFPGHTPIPMNKMMMGYIRSVLGAGTGQVIRIYE